MPEMRHHQTNAYLSISIGLMVSHFCDHMSWFQGLYTLVFLRANVSCKQRSVALVSFTWRGFFTPFTLNYESQTSLSAYPSTVSHNLQALAGKFGVTVVLNSIFVKTSLHPFRQRRLIVTQILETFRWIAIWV